MGDMVYIDFQSRCLLKPSPLSEHLSTETFDSLNSMVEIIESADGAEDLCLPNPEIDRLIYFAELCEQFLEAYEKIESDLVQLVIDRKPKR